VETRHLAESHLLSGLSGDGLSEQLGNLARVKVVDEAPNTRLAEAGKALVEIDVLPNSGEGVIVGALNWRSLTKHIGEKGCVTRLLLGHELDQAAVLSSETGGKEVFLGEDGKTVIEEVELNPLLVEAKSDRLEIEVGLNHVTRLSAVGAKATYQTLA